MSEFQKRLLPRLVLDTINCLQTVYGELDTDLRTETRENLASLLQMDVTDIESAIDVLLTVAQQLREVEVRLDAAGRPFAMRKVRSVRQRVEHAQGLLVTGSDHPDGAKNARLRVMPNRPFAQCLAARKDIRSTHLRMKRAHLPTAAPSRFHRVISPAPLPGLVEECRANMVQQG